MKLKETLLTMTAVSLAATVVAAQTVGLGDAVSAVGSVVEDVVGTVGRSAPGAIPVGQSATGYRWSGAVPPGQSLEIKGVNGSILVVAAEGSEAVVATEARGRRSDPASVRIERVEHEGGLTFCAVYPAPEGQSGNVCAPGESGRLNTGRHDVEVEFRVEVPQGVRFVGRTVNGSVEAVGLAGDVVARTVNGDVEISTTGFAEAETVNGSIDASMGRADPVSGAAFTTVNGSVTLDLHEDVDADIDARWMNGGFESEIPFLLEGRMSRHRARGILGQGGPELRLETVNGSIRIH
ncbi:MAG: hypothetical protein R3304_08030 [Longimicrobiales bacterium]|nr:hypothetical protein [Longimicrobiales bacterium]